MKCGFSESSCCARAPRLLRTLGPAMQFFYVYVLQSENNPEHFYVGFTENLAQRLEEHNDGKLPNTARYRP